MLKNKINTDFLTSFKNKEMEKKNFLGFIKSEIQRIEKNEMVADLDDLGVIEILNKAAKNLKESLSKQESDKLKLELEIVESYLPKQMSEEEIVLVIKLAISTGANNIGSIMKVFAEKNVDKKLASKLASELLK